MEMKGWWGLILQTDKTLRQYVPLVSWGESLEQSPHEQECVFVCACAVSFIKLY